MKKTQAKALAEKEFLNFLYFNYGSFNREDAVILLKEFENNLSGQGKNLLNQFSNIISSEKNDQILTNTYKFEIETQNGEKITGVIRKGNTALKVLLYPYKIDSLNSP